MYQHQHVKWRQSVPYWGFLSELFGRRREHAAPPSECLDAPLANPTRSDAQIAQDVKDELGIPTDDDIARECEGVLANLLPRSDYTIQVMVSNGWVTLSGDVAKAGERWIAETTVSALASVRGVNCQIKVRPAVRKDEVDANIEAAMRVPKGWKYHTIESAIDHDRVTLTGTVHSWNDRRAALNAAGSSTGVQRVFDHMKLHRHAIRQ